MPRDRHRRIPVRDPDFDSEEHLALLLRLKDAAAKIDPAM